MESIPVKRLQWRKEDPLAHDIFIYTYKGMKYPKINLRMQQTRDKVDYI